MIEPPSHISVMGHRTALRLVLGLLLGGLAVWAWMPAEPRQASVVVPRVADAAPAPWPSPAAAAPDRAKSASGALPPAALPPSRLPPPAPVPAGHALPTLDAAERAALREALAQAGAMDAASRRELESLLFHDGLLRLQALRQAGERGAEHDALVRELRAALPAHESGADLSPALLQLARGALAPQPGPP